MEQMMNMMLSMAQPSQDISAKDSAKPASKSENGKDFRDLMKRQLTKDAPKETVKETKVPASENNVSEAPAAVQGPVETESVNEQQMAVASVLVVQVQQPIVEQAPVTVQDTAVLGVAQDDAAETVVQTLQSQQAAMQQESGQSQQSKGDVLPGEQQAAAQENVQQGVVTEDTAQTFEVRPQAQDAKPVQQAEKAVQTATEGEMEVTVTNEEDGGVLAKPVFHDNEAIHIKVGDTTAAQAQQETPDVETQIGTRLTQALQNGESKVEVQLTPENLGTVKVEVTRDAQGALHILLSADNAQTRQLLERHAFNLQSVLAQQNANAVQVEVERGQEGRGDDGQREHGQNNPQQEQQGRQQERQRHERAQQQDFIQQLRLGLVPADLAAGAEL